ncbi:GNAT family N-acetyltransferase [Candidatus Chloroploca sp. Khr17]|uniref:GNAT family N-acetyltransferase n=1 Tax=Candidatus Chloroploca sp. Khr17 TaxID=2496869 RepID=UPI00101C23E7|nr:GNAT family N-acetyltransferase [Candidatus Chloroploca sp. Khr17]
MLDVSTAFTTFPVLHTERLFLRAPEPDDAAAMFPIMADPEVMRYFGAPPMALPDEALQRIAGIREAFAAQEGVRWAITLREDETLLGTCGFWRLIKPHFRAEVGYELGRTWWGRGLMTEALGAVLRFGFTQMGLHSVEAMIDPPNVASRRVLEKLGFVQEAYFRENYYDPTSGRFGDSAVFSLLRSNWLLVRGAANRVGGTEHLPT